MLAGFALLYVGAVLFLNGLWLMGRIGDKEISAINIFSGVHTLLISYYLALGPNADAASIKAAAFTLLFTFTYFWVAWNRWNNADGRGLGWFSLFVAITCVPIAYSILSKAGTTWDVWFGLCWVIWAVVWFMFYLLLVLGKPIAKITGAATSFAGVVTGWLPGYLLLEGFMGPAAKAAGN
jgi:hypothetical protein